MGNHREDKMCSSVFFYFEIFNVKIEMFTNIKLFRCKPMVAVANLFRIFDIEGKDAVSDLFYIFGFKDEDEEERCSRHWHASL